MIPENLHDLFQFRTEDTAVGHIVPVVGVQDADDLVTIIGVISNQGLDGDLRSIFQVLDRFTPGNAVTVYQFFGQGF